MTGLFKRWATAKEIEETNYWLPLQNSNSKDKNHSGMAFAVEKRKYN